MELAWAGGLFVGEGCTFSARGGAMVGLNVTQAGALDRAPDILWRFHRAVGGIGFVEGPQLRIGKLPKWRYRVAGYELVQAIIAMLWPWLGESKRLQARSVFRRWQALESGVRRPGNHFGRPLNAKCVRGHSYDDVYVDRFGARHCRPCRRLRDREGQRRRRAERRRTSTR